MENETTQKVITIEEFQSYMKQKVVPIEGLNIPNITVPGHLVSKKRATEANDTITVNIRFLFNSLTKENLPQVKEQLKEVIETKLVKSKDPKMLEEIATEILSNFMMSEQHIKNYMHLLNAISNICLILPSTEDTGPNEPNKEGKVTPTIRYYFLDKCREMILKLISEENIKKLAQYDEDDDDELDKYNREREKINNLIITICNLYEQRHTSNIKLTSLQLYPLISHNILDKHLKYKTELDTMDEDDDNYDTIRKICNLYAEQAYIFIHSQGSEFMKEPPMTINGKIYNIREILDRFKKDVIPSITESFLVSKCNDLLCLK